MCYVQVGSIQLWRVELGWDRSLQGQVIDGQRSLIPLSRELLRGGRAGGRARSGTARTGPAPGGPKAAPRAKSPTEGADSARTFFPCERDARKRRAGDDVRQKVRMSVMCLIWLGREACKSV